jgi:hypothetical protein
MGVETRGLTFSPSGLRRVVRNIRDAIYKDGILFSVHLSGNRVTFVGAEPYSTAQDSITGAGAPIVSRDTTVGVDLGALTALADFLGTIRDLKTQPGSVLLTAGKRRLIWLDEATGETLETPTGEPHPGTQTALQLVNNVVPCPMGDNGFNIGPERLVRLSKTNGGEIRFPISILFATFPGDTEKIPHLMCVKHGPTFRAVYAAISTSGMIQYLNKEDPSIDIQEALW